MPVSQLALAVLLLPVAGALLLAGRGWRLPRIVTVIVGPGVVWASFAASVALFFWLQTGGPAKGDYIQCPDITYWTWITSGSLQGPFQPRCATLSLFHSLLRA